MPHLPNLQTMIDVGDQLWPYISQGSGHESYCGNENLNDQSFLSTSININRAYLCLVFS